MSTRKPASNPGAPPWTYVVGAIATAAGIVWGIVSFFFARTPSQLPAPAATSSTVSVVGSGNVAIGTVSGGSVVIGDQQKPDLSIPAPTPSK